MRTVAYWLSLILVFMIPFEKLFTFGGRNGPTLIRFVGLFVAVFWIATVIVTDKFRKPHFFHILIFLFLLWNIASIFWSISTSLSMSRLTTYAQLVGLVLVLWDLFTTPAAVRTALQAYVLGACVSVVSTITNFLQGVTAHAYITRYSASGFNENEISLILALGIPMAWYLATVTPSGSRDNALLKIANYAYVPAALFSVLLTASRGGLVCTVPAFIFILATFTRLRLLQRVFLFAALVTALFFVQSYVPESSYERLAAASDELENGDLNGRGEVWQLGFNVFLEHPFTGVGTGTFQAATELGRAAHNAYLSILVEVGAIGFGLFLAIVAVSIQQALRQPRWESRLWLTVLLIWAVGVLLLSLEYRKPTWLILSLPVMAAQAYGWRPAWVFSPPRPVGQPNSALAHKAQ